MAYQLTEKQKKYLPVNDPEAYITKTGRFMRKYSLDELEIPVKARFDGEYLEKFGPLMDLRCFLRTIGSVLKSEGVVEGGTGSLHADY